VGEITDRVEWRSSMDFPREVIPKEARAATGQGKTGSSSVFDSLTASIFCGVIAFGCSSE
jgi:hypothetical protein